MTPLWTEHLRPAVLPCRLHALPASVAVVAAVAVIVLCWIRTQPADVAVVCRLHALPVAAAVLCRLCALPATVAEVCRLCTLPAVKACRLLVWPAAVADICRFLAWSAAVAEMCKLPAQPAAVAITVMSMGKKVSISGWKGNSLFNSTSVLHHLQMSIVLDIGFGPIAEHAQ